MNAFPKFLKLVLSSLFLLCLAPAWGQEAPPPPPPPAPPAPAAAPAQVTVELQSLIQEIGPVIQNAGSDPEALHQAISKLDELYAKYAEEKTEEVARVMVVKAMLAMEFLDDPELAMATFTKLEEDYAGTEIEGKAQAAKAKIEVLAKLSEGNPFPPFEVTDLEGKPLKLEDYRGQVVLLDFWATWCGPCVAELPNVLDTYNTYHDQGFEIIGISLDKSRESLDAFIEQHNMDWPQFFDGQGWQNALAQKYGIQSIPATFLLDQEGVIIGSGLRGGELKAAVAEALGEE